ncbi:hypothetical protein ABPG72_006781 [Tetrahymena utriculariae]
MTINIMQIIFQGFDMASQQQVIANKYDNKVNSIQEKKIVKSQFIKLHPNLLIQSKSYLLLNTSETFRKRAYSEKIISFLNLIKSIMKNSPREENQQQEQKGIDQHTINPSKQEVVRIH